jgi:HPt (histidine-containing phosphotransfer) domain-containing protein
MAATTISASNTREPATAPVDLDHLRRYTLGDRALELEVLQLFADQAPLTLADLRASRDDSAWRNAAHALKGSARAVGAWRVAQYAQAAECLGADAPTRQHALEAVEDAVAEAARYISALRTAI